MSSTSNAYGEATIERFVNQCIWRPRVTAAQCACVLDKYRAEFSETEFLELLNNPSANRRAVAFDETCGIGVAANRGRSQAPAAAAASASAAPNTPMAAKPPEGPTERAATDVEVCIQEKIAAAMAQSGGSVPVDLFDKVRAQCGG